MTIQDNFACQCESLNDRNFNPIADQIAMHFQLSKLLAKFSLEGKVHQANKMYVPGLTTNLLQAFVNIMFLKRI